MSGSKRDRATRLYHHLRSRPLPDQRRRRSDQRQQQPQQSTSSTTHSSVAEESPGETDNDQLRQSSEDSDSGSDTIAQIDEDDRAVHRRTRQSTNGPRLDVPTRRPDTRVSREDTTHRGSSRTAPVSRREPRGHHHHSPAPPSRRSRSCERRGSRHHGRPRHRVPQSSYHPASHRHRSRSPRSPVRRTRPPRSQRRRRRESSSSDSDSTVDYRWRSSSSSSSSSSSESSSSSPDSRSPSRSPRSRRHRHHRRHSRRHYQGERSFRWAQGSSPFVSCAPPPSDRTIARIRRGKYIDFANLLPNTDESIPVQAARATESRPRHKRPPKRSVVDFQSWMEAWNIFFLITAHTSHSQHRSPELLKYQALMGHLFSAYPTPVCIRYDQLFRRAAARDPSLRWDAYKEDLLIWCSTSRSFRKNITSRLGPPSASAAGGALQRATHNADGKEICLRYNKGNCTRGEECRFAHCCWHAGCRGTHSAKSCPLLPGV